LAKQTAPATVVFAFASRTGRILAGSEILRKRASRQVATSSFVIPAKAGIQFKTIRGGSWIPAFAGMTTINIRAQPGPVLFLCVLGGRGLAVESLNPYPSVFCLLTTSILIGYFIQRYGAEGFCVFGDFGFFFVFCELCVNRLSRSFVPRKKADTQGVFRLFHTAVFEKMEV
jgi:hypothetical protein